MQRHYALLSFFFDGVPDPAMLEAAKDELWRVREMGGTIYVHQPYAQDKCDECHRGAAGRMLTKVDSSSCLNCHADVADKHRMVHGPVAAGACLWCHSPHESVHKSLLRSSGEKLCIQCHGGFQSGGRTIAEHADPTRNCLECHTGHGGERRYYLR